MKKVAIITSTRAEFGLLMPIIKEMRKLENEQFKMELVVTGTHLSKEYGYTINEIENVGLNVDIKIEIPVNSNTPIDISNNQAITLNLFTKLFLEKKYSGIIILGDRYEMLAIAIAAGNTHTPIFHLCGGDTTEGAIDEWIRHSITKMSYLHFPTNIISYNRILQLGESPERVFNFGSTSIDNILNNAKMTKVEALNSILLNDCKYALCTYHPVTMDANNVKYLINEFIEAIKVYPEINFIVTKSNADLGGAEINKLLNEAEKNIDNLYVFSSLGVTRYLSLMKYSEFVLGNSSSGIIETPAFNIPTINIGDRQRGRLQSGTIINCAENKKSICSAIKLALSQEFKEKCKKNISLYGNGQAAKNISQKIYEIIESNKIDLKKKFYDIGEQK